MASSAGKGKKEKPVHRAPENPNARHRERLRDRFLTVGLEGFSDHEILELFLTLVIPRKDVKPQAKALLLRFQTLRGVLEAPIERLADVAGVGETSALQLKFLHAFIERILKDRARGSGPVLSSPDAVRQYLQVGMSGLREEMIQVMFLDAKNTIIDAEKLERGTVDQAAVYPRKVIERALHHNAVAFILVHNHPSGDPTPSDEDKDLTRILAAAARTMGMSLHDHIVIGKDREFSFRENGLLAG